MVKYSSGTILLFCFIWRVPANAELVQNIEPRCGSSELDAREHCRNTCISDADCATGQYCWGVHPNYCGSIPQRTYINPVQSTIWTRCGTDEIFARTFCTKQCNWYGDCESGETCLSLHSNYCGSAYTEDTGDTTTTVPPTTTKAETTAATTVPPTTTVETTTQAATTTTTINTAATVTTQQATTSVAATTKKATTQAATTTAPPPSPPSSCPAGTGNCGPGMPCSNGMCCSQWGWCGETVDYCGDCCQSNCWNDPPSPTTTTTVSAHTPTTPTYTPPTGGPPVADEDSRVIAYVGNWQTCPTPEQVDSYSHIIIAFSVSYTWAASQNQCSQLCQIASEVPICENMNRQDLVDSWRSSGKKVILSFGGAGMGGSWSGDPNNCWDYCFGREDQLSTALVNIVSNQNFDGVDIDYEYCYDIAGTQSGRCSQRTSYYSDAKAQNFLSKMTSLLRSKLDNLGSGYELTHAPMDTDLVPTTEYYQILKEQHSNLNFLMPQMYNGITRPVTDGVTVGSQGRPSAVSVIQDLAYDLFPGEPHKVVFGFCISDCSVTGSNASGSDAVKVLSDLKSYGTGEFACNGGAFFWVALHDTSGSWSDLVSAEVFKTSGCSSISATTTLVAGTTDGPGNPTTVAATTTTTTTTTTTSTTPQPTCVAKGNPCPSDSSQCCAGKCRGPKCA